MTTNFEERKLNLEKELEVLKDTLSNLSRSVSETQISIIEKNGELKLINKIIEDLK
jgi:uncharacterized coiled-coil protein SlyX